LPKISTEISKYSKHTFGLHPEKLKKSHIKVHHLKTRLLLAPRTPFHQSCILKITEKNQSCILVLLVGLHDFAIFDKLANKADWIFIV